MSWPFYRFVMCIVESEFNETPDYSALRDAFENMCFLLNFQIAMTYSAKKYTFTSTFHVVILYEKRINNTNQFLFLNKKMQLHT